MLGQLFYPKQRRNKQQSSGTFCGKRSPAEAGTTCDTHQPPCEPQGYQAISSRMLRYARPMPRALEGRERPQTTSYVWHRAWWSCSPNPFGTAHCHPHPTSMLLQDSSSVSCVFGYVCTRSHGAWPGQARPRTSPALARWQSWLLKVKSQTRSANTSLQQQKQKRPHPSCSWNHFQRLACTRRRRRNTGADTAPLPLTQAVGRAATMTCLARLPAPGGVHNVTDDRQRATTHRDRSLQSYPHDTRL